MTSVIMFAVDLATVQHGPLTHTPTPTPPLAHIGIPPTIITLPTPPFLATHPCASHPPPRQQHAESPSPSAAEPWSKNRAANKWHQHRHVRRVTATHLLFETTLATRRTH